LPFARIAFLTWLYFFKIGTSSLISCPCKFIVEVAYITCSLDFSLIKDGNREPNDLPVPTGCIVHN